MQTPSSVGPTKRGRSQKTPAEATSSLSTSPREEGILSNPVETELGTDASGEIPVVDFSSRTAFEQSVLDQMFSDVSIDEKDILCNTPKMHEVLTSLLDKEEKKRPNNVLRSTLSAVMTDPYLSIGSHNLDRVPFFSDYLYPELCRCMRKHAEAFALLKLGELKIKQCFVSQFTLATTYPNSMPLNGIALAQSTVEKDFSDKTFPWYGFNCEMISQSQRDKMFVLFNLVLMRAVLKFSFDVNLFVTGANPVTPAPWISYVLSAYRPVFPKSFSEGKTALNATMRASLTSDFAIAFKGYQELVRRLHFGTTEDIFGLHERVNQLGQLVHAGLMALPQAITQGWPNPLTLVPGYASMKKLDSADFQVVTDEVVNKVVDRLETSGVKVKDSPEFKELFAKVSHAAESAGKVGDNIASVIDVLRNSIPIFGVFFTLVLYVSFRNHPTIAARERLMAITTALTVAYFGVPLIWDALIKLSELMAAVPVPVPGVDIEMAETQGITMSEDGVSTLVSLVALMGFRRPEKNAVESLLSPLGSVQRGVKELIRVAYELFVMCSTSVQEWFGWNQSVWGVFCPTFKEWQAQVNEIMDAQTLGTLEISATSEDRLAKVISCGEALMVDLSKGPHRALVPLIRTALTGLGEAYSNICQKRKNYVPNKPSAPCVFLYGPAKQGKTELSKFLIDAYLKLTLDPAEYAKYLAFPTNYVKAAPKDKFWDNIGANIKVLKMPEAFQFPPVKGQESSDARTIYTFCDPEEAVVRCADVKMKGMIAIQPEIVVATSNLEAAKSDDVHSVDGLCRRLNIPIRVMLKPGGNPKVIDPDNFELSLGKPKLDGSGEFAFDRMITIEEVVFQMVRLVRIEKNKNRLTANIVASWSERVQRMMEAGDLGKIDDLLPEVMPIPTMRFMSEEEMHSQLRDFMFSEIPEPEQARQQVGYEVLPMIPDLGVSNRIVKARDFGDSDNIGFEVTAVHQGEGVEAASYARVESLDQDVPSNMPGAFREVREVNGVARPVYTRKIVNQHQTVVGYRYKRIPDGVPFLHGLKMCYPTWKHVSQLDVYDENGLLKRNMFNSDDIWEWFGSRITGFAIKASEVKRCLTAKFGDLSDWTIDRLIVFEGMAREVSPAFFGFTIDVSKIWTAKFRQCFQAVYDGISKVMSTCRNVLYDTIAATMKFLRENEGIVRIGLGLVGAYLAYSYFKGEAYDDADTESGNGNVNFGREVKQQNIAKAKEHLRTLRATYRAKNQSGIDNSKSRIDVVTNNMVKMYGKHLGKTVHLGYVLFVCERTFVCPSHFLSDTMHLQLSEGVAVEEMHFFLNFKDDVMTPFKFVDIDVIADDIEGDPTPGILGRITMLDLAIISVNGIPEFRDIRKHFTTQSILDGFKGGKPFIDALLVSPAKTIANLRVNRRNIESFSPVKQVKALQSFMGGYEFSGFGAGDCGRVLVNADGQILGFHTNGNKKYGYATMFSRDLIDGFLGKAKEVVKDGEPVPEFSVAPVPLDIAIHGYDPACHVGDVVTYRSSFPSSTYVKNKIIPTHGLTKPYVERQTAVVQTTRSLYPQARLKYQPQPVFAKDEHVQLCVRQVHSELFSLDPEWKRDTFSFMTAWTGMEGTSFKKLPLQTSAGHPLSTLGIKKLDYAFYDDAGKFVVRPRMKECHAEVQSFVDEAMSGAVPCVGFMDTLKSERRAKTKTLKPRLVSVAPLVLTIVCRMVYGPIMEYFMAHAVDCGFAFSVNPYSWEWDHLARKLQEKGGQARFGAGDYSGFDSRHPARYMRWIFDEWRAWFPKDGWDPVRLAVAECICRSMHHYGSVVEFWECGMPSGNPLTTLINCVLNLVYFRYWWFKVHQFDKVCLPAFRDHMCLFVNGDDNVYGITEEYADLATEQKIGEVFLDLGQTYTDDQKLGPTPNLRLLQDITLSKRKFVYDEENEVYVAPQDLAGILEIPLWTKNKDSKEIAEDNARTAIRELALHGKAVFDEWVPKIVAFSGIVPETTDWEIQYAITRKSDGLV
jgi:hypothetical protein